MRFRNFVVKLCLSLTATVLSLIFLEIVLRSYQVTKRFFIYTNTYQLQPVPLHIVTGSPILYGLNPEHPEISSQALRDDEVTIPKPKGTFRILVLGDSVAYGWDVPRNKTFSNRLENLLREQFGSIDVINAGVSGYTAYNELQYYLTKGLEFEADIVIIAFCMNDVVNPRLHWQFTKEVITNIPEEAIPNHDYDLSHVIPRVEEMKKRKIQSKNLNERSSSLLKYFELYNIFEWRVKHVFRKKPKHIANIESEIPTYITGEDTLSIEVLLDKSSPEWRWLTSIYDRLHKAVQADQATLIIAIFPLAYQLNEDYPFLPQKQIAEYCQQNSILCIDLLTSFRQHPKNDIFLNNSGHYDNWHLAEYGHELSAKEILRFLPENDLLLRSQ